MAELKWYVLRAIAGQEKKIKHYIESEISKMGVADALPQILIPVEKVYEIRNGKKRVREKSLYPGYMYLQGDFSENGEIVHFLNSVPNVIGFLGDEQEKDSKRKIPTPIRESEVMRILGKMDEIDQDQEYPETPFIVGETILVMDGPFNGFNGTVEEVYEDKKKLSVTVKIFGRNTPVELNYSQVEKTT